MTRPRDAWLKFFLTRAAGLVIDAIVLGSAYLASFLLRFDFIEPRWGWRVVALSFAPVLALHLVAMFACGCYRMSWRRTRLVDIPWYLIAAASACVAMTALRFLTPVETYMHLRPPYSITLISFVLCAAGVVGWRLLWTWCSRFFVRDERLIERDVRTMDSEPVLRFLRGKTVMVTGAGGSIGSEIVRQLVCGPGLTEDRNKIALPDLGLNARRIEHAHVHADVADYGGSLTLHHELEAVGEAS